MTYNKDYWLKHAQTIAMAKGITVQEVMADEAPTLDAILKEKVEKCQTEK